MIKFSCCVLMFKQENIKMNKKIIRCNNELGILVRFVTCVEQVCFITNFPINENYEKIGKIIMD